MTKSTGFMQYRQKSVPYRDSGDRQRNFYEIFTEPSDKNLKRQSAGTSGHRNLMLVYLLYGTGNFHKPFAFLMPVGQ